MTEAYTRIAQSPFELVGGENITVENNRTGAVINLQSDLDMIFAYRGNFHTFELDNNVVTVRDTSFTAPDSETLPSEGGTVKLRWLKIVQDQSSREYYSQPCSCLVTAPALIGKTVTDPGWLLLKMKRTNSTAHCTVNDDQLGQVNLQFQYLISSEIPEDTSTASYAALASLQIDENDGNLEIFQQHTGIPELWIPVEISSAEESSSSSSSSSTEPPEESSSSSSSVSSSSSDEDPPWENSSSSSEKSGSSSSSNNTYDEQFIVVLSYEETTREYAGADEVFTNKTTYLFSGVSMLLPSYPPGGYHITVKGTKTVFHNDGTIDETELTSYIELFHDTTSGQWSYYFEYDNNWSKFMDYYDENNDIMYTTPQYITYPYANAPHNPLGMLMVDHLITYNYSQAVQTQEFSSSLMLHVYA